MAVVTMAPARRWWQRRGVRLGLGAVLLVDLAVLGTDAWLLSQRSSTTVVDLDDALSTFRATSAPEASSTTTVTVASAGDATVPGAATGAPIPASLAAPTTAQTPGTTPTSAPTSAPATPKAGALAPPEPGVYAYRTTGGERVSLLGAAHAYPSETYATVRRTGGCGWELRAAVVAEHVDRREMCSEADHLLQLEQQRAVTFFGTTDGATLRCTPAQLEYTLAEAAGHSDVSTCSDGKGSDARMVRTLVGFGTATVAGTTVDTATYEIVGTMTGRVRGSSTDRYTVVRSTGLPIRLQRSVDTVADAFGTSVGYQEQASFTLVSLTPRT